MKSLCCRDENLIWMCKVTRKDRKRNTFIREQLGIISIENKMRKNRLRQYEHMLRKPPDAVVRISEMINISDTKKDRRRPKKILIETINKDISTLNLTKHMTFYKSQ